MVLSVAVNVVLAVLKVTVGLVGHSNALIADGIESSLDTVSAAMIWLALRYAERPPDSDHPYGHGKMESLAATIGALLLIGAGGALGVHSVFGLIARHADVGHAPGPAPYALGVLAFTIVAKEMLFRWLSWRAEVLESQSVRTDAWHHRSDALTSLAAAAGITLAVMGGPSFAQADNWAALFSCGLIVFNGVSLLRQSVGEILDEQASNDVVNAIIRSAMDAPGVTSVEKCRVRKSGLMRIADLHVRVAGERTVREGHQIAHVVKDKLMDAGLHLADVTVHVEPQN